jgi:hypothetical protein
MGVTHFAKKNPKTGVVVLTPIAMSSKVKAALETPVVQGIIARYRRVVIEGKRDRILYPGKDCETCVDDEVGAVHSAAQLEFLQRRFDRAATGTWAKFDACLQLHPRRAVLFRHFLARQRETWVEELVSQELRWGERLGDWDYISGPELNRVSGLDPSAVPDAEDALDDEWAIVEECEGHPDGDEDPSDWSNAAVGDDADDADEAATVQAIAAAARAGGKPPFRGKAFYPPLITVAPAASAIRRSCHIIDASSLQAMGATLGEVFQSLPDFPKGAQLASSGVTNGYSVSFPYLRRQAPDKAQTRDGDGEEEELVSVSASSARAPLAATTPADRIIVGGTSADPARPDEPVISRAMLPLSMQNRIIVVDSGGTWIYMTLEIVLDPVTGLKRERVVGLSTREWRARRGDDKRLELTRKWCAHLAAPGGAFERLAAVTRKTSSPAQFLAYCLVAHGDGRLDRGALAEVLDERLKARWAHAAFRTWSKGHSILEGFWGGLRTGRLEDGTYGVRPLVLYGKVNFSATGKGRHSSPTTAARKACNTVCGNDWVRDANEHRSTKCCSGCHCVLDKVLALTPERIYAAAAAKAARPLPFGWVRPPARDIHPLRIVRGLLYCPSYECRTKALKHRDVDACRLILANALAVDAHFGTLPCMAFGRREELPAGKHLLWP